MNRLCQEGVGGAHHGADIGIVVEIFNRHMQWVPPLVQIGDNGRQRPVSVGVDHVAPVTGVEKLWVIGLTDRARAAWVFALPGRRPGR